MVVVVVVVVVVVAVVVVVVVVVVVPGIYYGPTWYLLWSPVIVVRSN